MSKIPFQSAADYFFFFFFAADYWYWYLKHILKQENVYI